MKKLILTVMTFFLMLTSSNHAMHEVVRAEPAARSEKSDNYVHAGIAYIPTRWELPIEVKAVESSKIKNNLSSQFKNLLSKPLNQDQDNSVSIARPINSYENIPTARAESIRSVIHEELINLYDTQGRIISEPFIDGRMRNTNYLSNGDVVTTIFDSNGVKIEEKTKQPNGAVIIKFYNQAGKFNGTVNVNPDGSVIETNTNGYDGTIIDSNIYNKQGQLEVSMHLDDFGNRSIINLNSIGERVILNNQRDKVTVHANGSKTVESSPDEQGNVLIMNQNNKIYIKKDRAGMIIERGRFVDTGIPESVLINIYDKNNKLIKRQLRLKGRDNLTEICNLTLIDQKPIDGFIVDKYENKLFLTKYEYFQSGTIKKLTFDFNNNLINEAIIKHYNIESKKSKDTKFLTKEIIYNYYDDMGIKITSEGHYTYVSADGKEILENVVIAYDEQGRVEGEKLFIIDSNGQEIEKSLFNGFGYLSPSLTKGMSVEQKNVLRNQQQVLVGYDSKGNYIGSKGKYTKDGILAAQRSNSKRNTLLEELD